MFENSVQRTIFGPERDKVTGQCRRLLNEEACSTYEGEEMCIWVLVGKPEGKRPLGRNRCRWDSNIKMDLQEVGWGVMD